jgi:hypothetical protein
MELLFFNMKNIIWKMAQENQLLNQIAMVLKLTPITTAMGKIIPVSVILTMGIEIAIIPVAKLQIIAVLPIFTPCPSISFSSTN